MKADTKDQLDLISSRPNATYAKQVVVGRVSADEAAYAH